MSTLGIAKSGLVAFQKAIDMTSHNIANANTNGFKKSVAVFSELPSYGIPPIGTGVMFNKTTGDALADLFDSRIFDQYGDVGMQEGIRDVMNLIPEEQIPTLVNRLDEFNVVAKQLADDPTSLPVKQEFLGRAQNLVNAVNDTLDSLSVISSSAEQAIQQNLDQVNNLTYQIAYAQKSGLVLTDKIEELSKYINVDYRNDNGVVSITTDNGIPLVNGSESYLLTADDVTPAIGGYLGGIRKAIDAVIPEAMTMLDGTMTSYVNRVNNEYYKGTYLHLFDRSVSGFNVVPTQAAQIKAGDTPEGNENALAIVDLLGSKNGRVSSLKMELLQAEAFIESTRNINDSSLDVENNVLQSFIDGRAEKYGVKLDEEAVNLLKYKQAYEAMTKLIAADQAMFNSLLAVV